MVVMNIIQIKLILSQKIQLATQYKHEIPQFYPSYDFVLDFRKNLNVVSITVVSVQVLIQTILL